ncbi:ankyrin repeat domain-containing protein [Streptomyces orinoci]|uniref:Ankyrin repeat domain-containing protein n=1 Tax=Streptomyces orinoci TaxID=67339 RepID=A0ABV3JS32_STRON
MPPLLAAVERGDDRTVFDLLDEVPEDELTGDDGVTLLAAAAYAGRHEVVSRLVEDGVDVTRPWAAGLDPVTWAAERGAYWVLNSLLIRSGDPLSADSPHRRALRVAQAAIDSEAAWVPGPPPAHRAIVSRLEAALGIHRSPDELMARALVHARPDHDDWFESLHQLGCRVGTDQELFQWACAVAGDPSSLARRRFGLEALKFLGFGMTRRPTRSWRESPSRSCRSPRRRPSSCARC